VNIFSKIGKSIFAVYAIIIVALSHLIIIPAYFFVFIFLPKKNTAVNAHKVSRFWAWLLFTFFFIRTNIKGKEYIDPNQAYVFVSNHSSQLDIPLFARACTNTFRFLSKIEVTRIPLIGYIVKRIYITVDRKDRRDKVRSVEKMKSSLLDDGVSIVLFPEGTRNRSERPLLDFKDGAFRLAVEAQLPIAVLTILNTREYLPANKFEMKPGVVRAIWSEPIQTKGLTLDDIPKLKELVKEVLLKNLG
jgi:1-acyl-sn-glycerol-3-phosphate acyltransferase